MPALEVGAEPCCGSWNHRINREVVAVSPFPWPVYTIQKAAQDSLYCGRQGHATPHLPWKDSCQYCEMSNHPEILILHHNYTHLHTLFPHPILSYRFRFHALCKNCAHHKPSNNSTQQHGAGIGGSPCGTADTPQPYHPQCLNEHLPQHVVTVRCPHYQHISAWEEARTANGERRMAVSHLLHVFSGFDEVFVIPLPVHLHQLAQGFVQ